MIFIDSDVFLIDLRYKRDPKFYENKEFLQKVQKTGNGVTSIFNLLEICGVLSFNLNNQQLKELFYYFPLRYNIKILPTSDESARLPIPTVKQIMQVIAKKVPFGDALIITFIEKIEGISTFVSSNAKHFVNRLSISAVTSSDVFKRGLL